MNFIHIVFNERGTAPQTTLTIEPDEAPKIEALYPRIRAAMRFRQGQRDTRRKRMDGRRENDYGLNTDDGGGMKYWELFFLTVGAGCFVGLIITPSSWLAGPTGVMATIVGYACHVATQKGE